MGPPLKTRPQLQRGGMFNRAVGKPENQLRERHSAHDSDVNRQDIVEARGGNWIRGVAAGERRDVGFDGRPLRGLLSLSGCG
jgi:hypothetical protein